MFDIQYSARKAETELHILPHLQYFVNGYMPHCYEYFNIPGQLAFAVESISHNAEDVGIEGACDNIKVKLFLHSKIRI